MQVNANTTNGIVQEIERQRNQALTGMAQYAGQVAELRASLAEAQKRIQELEAVKADKPEAEAA